MRFAGKKVLVTAAAHGIGRATAERLRDEGALVWALDRDREALDAIEGVRPVFADLTDPQAIAALPLVTGPIDVLANIGGFVAAGSGSLGEASRARAVSVFSAGSSFPVLRSES